MSVISSAKIVVVLNAAIIVSACTGGAYNSPEACTALGSVAVFAKTNYVERHVNETDAIALIQRRPLSDETKAVFINATRYAIANAALPDEDLRSQITNACHATESSKLATADFAR
jgi:hypothetical protein